MDALRRFTAKNLPILLADGPIDESQQWRTGPVSFQIFGIIASVTYPPCIFRDAWKF